MPAKPGSVREHHVEGTPVSANAMAKPRVLLADDHTLVAEALGKLLEPEFDVVGRVADGRALLESAVRLIPDVIILDLSMPLLNGIDAGRRLKEILPRTKLIVLTVNEDPEVAAEALRTWASGFLLKKSIGNELAKAVKKVLSGESYVTTILATRPTHVRSASDSNSLTIRQREVLQLLAEGRTMKEAAAVLGVTPRTVAFHKYKIMRDFGLRTNSDLIRLAITANLVPSMNSH